MHLPQFVARMQQEGLDTIVIDTFAAYYRHIIEGATGKMSHAEIGPPDANSLADYHALPEGDPEVLKKLVFCKLNGGLGTGMGLSRAKSLLPVKQGLSFLDIIARQALHLCEQGLNVPLLFMNSFNTRDDTLAHLSRYPNLALHGLPLDFVQNKFPKVRRDDLTPLEASDDKLNWNPPGHGDIYMALAISGVLDLLLERGYEYMFVSNSDNLGAIVDDRIATYFARLKLPFLMEVCRRTEMDSKGGHLCQSRDGRLLLRESAQCPDDEVGEFQDVSLYSWFNTNNLWVNLKALKQRLDANDNVLELPLILNAKVVEGVPVYQVETAMGAAIGVFEGARAIIVPRTRFAPVKKTNDLFSLWSDVFVLTDDWRVALAAGRTEAPVVTLDERFFKTIGQLEQRVPSQPPSLLHCTSLEVAGDVTFGDGVVVKGEAHITATSPMRVEHTTVEGETLLG
ncbi:MAG: UTP--glucose-1-phosphate uridylyltransferase [Candidatus Cloacimonetes bacterium]|nr:UTP--glucose-1-phosphate uridylyltransferase [Candidatus Cloacimonadota bacterium]